MACQRFLSKPYIGYLPCLRVAGCLPYPWSAGLTNPYIGYKTPYIGYDKPYISYDKPYISYLPTVHQLSIHRVTH